ncbi:hypothetical protein B0H19DRAFT_1092071 [Mycena capillaripes]|nr:hypothetical protein B0H19DRAFT_1092071 [Mycena capillaripes]
MSLPANVKLSVQGHSRPGDTSHSIPKQAMIVRMTAETLDALQATPNMEFTFGPEPGISIGDAFFPMRPLKENWPHDLYLRASSATKPMAPLKLYANITGKFTVERDLVKVQDKIRSTTLGAEKIRKERGITVLDTPPADLSSSQSGKKRKAPPANSSLFRKPIAQPRPSTSTAARAPSPLPPATSSAISSPLRTAVVRALAVKERSFDELVRLIPGENDVEKRKRKLAELLNQIAEQPNATKSPSQWRLKPATWVEVRPYEWNDLTDPERITMARTARLTFSNLKIPESDPVWVHVAYRKNAESSMVASGSASSKASAAKEAPKRGVSSKEAKEKKMKPKPDPKTEILMRDESRPAPRPSNAGATKGKETDDGTSTKATASRKTPGSGFKISKVPSPDTQPPPAPPVPAPDQVTRGRPVDVRMKDRAPPRASLPAKPAPPIPRRYRRKRQVRLESRRSKMLVRLWTRKGSGERNLLRILTIQTPCLVPSQKDAKQRDGSCFDAQRSVPSQETRNFFARSIALPSPKTTKREPSPLPASEASSLPPPPRSSLPARPTAGSSSSNQAHSESHSNSKHSNQIQRSNSSLSKRRERRSPIYTHEPTPLPTPPAVQPSNRSRGQQPSTANRPLPTDRNGLRKRYNATYLKYLASYQQLFAQQSKLESLLNGRDGSTISDSDGDVEVLSAEDTMKLKAEHKRWERELENIRSMFATTERSESKSD